MSKRSVERLRGGGGHLNLNPPPRTKFYGPDDAGPLCEGGCGFPVVTALADAGQLVHPTCAPEFAEWSTAAARGKARGVADGFAPCTCPSSASGTRVPWRSCPMHKGS